ncbi:MAG: ATP-binding protein [Desulfobacterales bacterium]|nr:ATP-binding protein [Desulfobacterales bacterium]
MVEYEELNKTVVIPSKIEEIGRVITEVKAYIEKEEYEGKKYIRLMGALYEAVANAIIHGNKIDEGKRVFVTYFDDKDKFQVKVADEGEGFDISSVSDSCSPDNITKPRGRGIFIIKGYVDEVSFNEKGNEITLTIIK